MNFLNKSIINFCLHECKINSVIVSNSTLELSFSDGIYLNGVVVKNVNLILFIPNLRGNEYAHISIYKFVKNKRYYIEFNEWIKILNKKHFYVDVDLYSDLAKGILLKGYVGSEEFEMFITDIEEVYCRNM